MYGSGERKIPAVIGVDATGVVLTLHREGRDDIVVPVGVHLGGPNELVVHNTRLQHNCQLHWGAAVEIYLKGDGPRHGDIVELDQDSGSAGLEMLGVERVRAAGDGAILKQRDIDLSTTNRRRSRGEGGELVPGYPQIIIQGVPAGDGVEFGCNRTKLGRGRRGEPRREAERLGRVAFDRDLLARPDGLAAGQLVHRLGAGTQADRVLGTQTAGRGTTLRDREADRGVGRGGCCCAAGCR